MFIFPGETAEPNLRAQRRQRRRTRVSRQGLRHGGPREGQGRRSLGTLLGAAVVHLRQRVGRVHPPEMGMVCRCCMYKLHIYIYTYIYYIYI